MRFHTKDDGSHTKDDGSHTKNDEFYILKVNGIALNPLQLTPSPIASITPPTDGHAGNWNNAFNAGPRGHGNLVNLNNGAGIGKFHLHSDIFLGGRADLDGDRFCKSTTNPSADTLR